MKTSMRTRKEVEENQKLLTDKNSTLQDRINLHTELSLEVLLDIRDLLEMSNKNVEILKEYME